MWWLYTFIISFIVTCSSAVEYVPDPEGAKDDLGQNPLPPDGASSSGGNSTGSSGASGSSGAAGSSGVASTSGVASSSGATSTTTTTTSSSGNTTTSSSGNTTTTSTTTSSSGTTGTPPPTTTNETEVYDDAVFDTVANPLISESGSIREIDFGNDFALKWTIDTGISSALFRISPLGSPTNYDAAATYDIPTGEYATDPYPFENDGRVPGRYKLTLSTVDSVGDIVHYYLELWIRPKISLSLGSIVPRKNGNFNVTVEFPTNQGGTDQTLFEVKDSNGDPVAIGFNDLLITPAQLPRPIPPPGNETISMIYNDETTVTLIATIKKGGVFGAPATLTINIGPECIDSYTCNFVDLEKVCDNNSPTFTTLVKMADNTTLSSLAPGCPIEAAKFNTPSKGGGYEDKLTAHKIVQSAPLQKPAGTICGITKIRSVTKDEANNPITNKWTIQDQASILINDFMLVSSVSPLRLTNLTAGSPLLPNLQPKRTLAPTYLTDLFQFDWRPDPPLAPDTQLGGWLRPADAPHDDYLAYQVGFPLIAGDAGGNATYCAGTADNESICIFPKRPAAEASPVNINFSLDNAMKINALLDTNEFVLSVVGYGDISPIANTTDCRVEDDYKPTADGINDKLELEVTFKYVP